MMQILQDAFSRRFVLFLLWRADLLICSEPDALSSEPDVGNQDVGAKGNNQDVGKRIKRWYEEKNQDA